MPQYPMVRHCRILSSPINSHCDSSIRKEIRDQRRLIIRRSFKEGKSEIGTYRACLKVTQNADRHIHVCFISTSSSFLLSIQASKNES
jgi:hypothetical protein